jgi:hypothetical protein
MSGSVAAADERLEKLFDALFDSVLEVSPQLAMAGSAHPGPRERRPEV